MTVSNSSRSAVLTVAQKGYLITQRRLCVRKGDHLFKVDSAKSLTVESAVEFFRKCDDVRVRNVQNSVGAIRWIWLARID